MSPPTTVEGALEIIDMFKAEQAMVVDHIVKTDTNYLSKRRKSYILYLKPSLTNPRQARHPRSRLSCSKVSGANPCSPKLSERT